MKVAIFTDTFLPQINGVTNTLSKLVEYFQQRNIEYRLFAPSYYQSNPSESDIIRSFSFKFPPYPENRIALPNQFRINQILDQFAPDVIHLMTELNLGVAGLNYGKKRGIPVISNYTTNFPEYMEYYNVAFLKEPAWSYMKWFHNQAGKTFSPSKSACTMLQNHGISRVGIFSRGVDTNLFHPRKRNLSLRNKWHASQKTIFLYVGRISQEKNLSLFMESYNLLKKKYHEKILLVMTGDGPLLDECKEKLPKDTIFTGFKKGEALAEVYASADIFVCPSASETFGNVMLEAMASGLAVLGANAGGIGELIQHKQNGLKFHPDSVIECFQYMEELLENTLLKKQLCQEGLKTSQARSWSSIFENLMKEYESLLTTENKEQLGA